MDTSQNKILWTPKAPESTLLYRFKTLINKSESLAIHDYNDLWSWSVTHPDFFWNHVWDFTGVIGDKGTRIMRDEPHMKDIRFFPDATLNWAENLLRRRDDGIAIISKVERRDETNITFQELYNRVSQLRQYLIQEGITEGDRVAGYLPNITETIIAALATASLGAIWSSASPDFGVQGVIDRFGQIEPKLLITTDGYFTAVK